MTKNDELICITLGLDILLITIVLTQSLNIFLISSFCVKKAQFKEGADAAAEVA